MMDDATCTKIDVLKNALAEYKARDQAATDAALDLRIAERDGDEAKIADADAVLARALNARWQAFKAARRATGEVLDALGIDGKLLARVIG